MARINFKKYYSVCDAVNEKKLWRSFDDDMLRCFYKCISVRTKNNERDTKIFNSHLILAQNYKQKLNVCLKLQTVPLLRNFHK